MLMTISSKMTKKQYNLVQNDEYDCRIPLHTDEAFQHGITFQAKYIGTLDVPRPSSRVEIVAAMRRIRYEYKAKGLKKKKVSIMVSTEGVKVSLRKKRKKKNEFVDESKLLVMQHPVYRIFYVSHDSQDLKIFSYIARESHSNVFKCSVFKAAKKSQAMKVVRTVGQAFEVCHKLECGEEEDSEHSTSGSVDLSAQLRRITDASSDPLSMDLPPYDSSDIINTALQRPNKLEPLSLPPGGSNMLLPDELFASPLAEPLGTEGLLPLAGTPLSAHHEQQLLREQALQYQQQAKAALAQVHLLRDQLKAEAKARVEAQQRTHQLLVQNKELLSHISVLVRQLRLAEQPPAPASSDGRSDSAEDELRDTAGPSGASSLDCGLGSSSVSAGAEVPPPPAAAVSRPSASTSPSGAAGLFSRLTRGTWARHTTT
ncbi:carboxyl-terminal PDZ ligand of neuronal nitric oxide synthase protein-like [Amphibalanus amphitrite]|uniref:carboxyl-terminal PDZ ligand of neuronal nitric oxide synthase protein-like n=1 Tax=Amphibalanus amphitrite TaxID=1232801 RepID=UPI001C91BF13|nr:carboxyl-terminal PDZ ligand of neuronal nitric oxide synthase protein-like [Amphibalanus amphitrite]